ncbi:helix-turn-helix transcriptional regulator [Actinomadura vinacea]
MLLGKRLRELRLDHGVTPDEAAHAVGASRSKITRMELGRIGLRSADVAALLTRYGVHDHGERSTLLALAEQTGARAWWYELRDVVPKWKQRYLSAEGAARLVRCFEDEHVPELLRTEAYALGVMRGDGAVLDPARRLDLLGQRQPILRRRPRPVNLWAVLDESVLWRTVGDAATMRAQLEHLNEICWRPNVTIQIAPINICGRVATDSPLTLVRFPQQHLSDLVYLERSGGADYPARRAEIEHHWHVFNTLVTEAAPPEMTPLYIERALGEY